MSKHIDALYEAAQKATPGRRVALHIDYGYEETTWERTDGSHDDLTDEDFDLVAKADRETVMALVEVARKGRKWKHWRGSVGGFPAQYRREAEDELAAAIEKVEALG